MVVVAPYLPIAREVGQEDVVDELTEPRGVAQREGTLGVGKGIFRGVPVLRVGIGLGGRTEVAHRGAASVGGYVERVHTRLDRVEIVLVLCRRGGDDCGGGSEGEEYGADFHLRVGGKGGGAWRESAPRE